MTTTATDTRALDAHLAEHLFGCTVRITQGFGELIYECERHDHWPSHPWNSGVGRWVIPDLSTTGDGMLLVAEKLREHGWGVEFRREPTDLPWFARVVELRDSGTYTIAIETGATLPLAVARAAKAALKAEEAARA